MFNLINKIKSKIPASIKGKIRTLKGKIKTLLQLNYRDLIRLIQGKAKLPTIVKLEACSLCQLDCRYCRMRQRKYGNRGAGYLKFTDFVKFMEMNPFVKEIALSNAGEIFLNPDLSKIIQFAHLKGVKLNAWGGVNFNSVSNEALEFLVKYKFQGFNIALDGASQEAYSWYRRNGNFDKVIDNIKKLNEYKKKYNSEFPFINWQYIIFKSNQTESEIKKAKEIAKSLNCRITFVKDWEGFIPDDEQMIEKETGLCYKNAEIRSDWGQKRELFCVELWKTPQFNYDGRFFGCCANIDADFGLNVFELGVEKCLDSKIVRKTLGMLMGGAICKESPCYDCCFYKKFVQEGNFITKDEMKNRKGVYS